MSKNLTPEEKRDWILENCIDKEGNIDLSDLDFSRFYGDVCTSFMKVKRTLFQNGQEVEGKLFQCRQKVKRNLHQDNQEVKGNLYQYSQKVGGDLSRGLNEITGKVEEVAEKTEEEKKGDKKMDKGEENGI